MIQYFSELSSRLKSYKNGMDKEPELWQNQPEGPAKVQEKIVLVDAKEKEVGDLKDLLSVKQAEGHALVNEVTEYADRLGSTIIGLVGTSVERLTPYGIKPRKTAARKPAPSKTLLPVLADDTDGIGFIVSTQTDPDAEHYEWYKGLGADPSKTDVIPEMKFFKISKKTSFVDDEVPKGVRVFYKVRAVNNAGQGPWSEAVSRVQ